ncbi:MAG: fibro-slime domain-containing protein, partial [Archangiaceae bacterium]|nr:fibro-slime domain-containing protein [Archangiaceae bacterium]
MRRLSMTPAVVALLLLLTPLTSEASRLSGGALTWTRDLTFMSATQARFTLKLRLSLRASFYAPVTVGQVINGPSVTLTPNGGAATVVSVPLTVTSINTVDDVIFTEGTAVVTLNLSGLPASVVYTDCCRVTGLADGNASQAFRLVATLTSAQRSPESSLVPRVFVSRGLPSSFSIPVTASGGATVSFSVPPGSATGLVVTQPAGLTLSSSGLVAWTPTTLGLHALQVLMTGSDGTVSTLDFAIQVLDPMVSVAFTPSSCGQTFTAPLGREVTFDVTAASTSPADQVQLVSSVLPHTAQFRPVTQGATSTSRFHFTRGRADTETAANICFQAQGLTATSLGNCCNTISFPVTSTQALPGVFRDFSRTAPDFAAFNGDGPLMVAPTLGPGRKPQLTAGMKVTVASASSFARWWSDAVGGDGGVVARAPLTLPVTETLTPGVFGFQTTSLNAMDYAPGLADGPLPNRNFTWELHDSMPYQPGRTLGFASADDLWVFWNGRLVVDLGGVHSRASFALSLDAVASQVGAVPGGSYPLDVFFAHRGAHDPELQLEVVRDPVCAAPARSVTAADLTVLGQGVSALDGGVRLLSATGSIDAGAGGVFLSSPLPAEGVQVEFSARLSPSSPGMALVFAAAPGLGRDEVVVTDGGSFVDTTWTGNDLGYASVPNSFALELDPSPQQGLGDPLVNHLSVMSRFDLPNSTNHALAELGTLRVNRAGCTWLDFGCGGPFFFGGTAQRVRVAYQRGPGQPTGWLRVWHDPLGGPLVSPSLEVEVDAAKWQAAFASGTLYVGFTTNHLHRLRAQGSTVTAAVDGGVIDVTAISVVSNGPGSASSVTTPPASLVTVSTPVTLRLRASDSCGNVMRAGGFGSVVGGVVRADGGVVAPALVNDRQDGTYDVTYTPGVGGVWSVEPRVAGVALGGAFTTVVMNCGDGVVHGSEACDDGALNGNYGRCNAMCTGPGLRCGDGTINGPEQCDDNNTMSGDGCSSSCTVEVMDAGAGGGNAAGGSAAGGNVAGGNAAGGSAAGGNVAGGNAAGGSAAGGNAAGGNAAGGNAAGGHAAGGSAAGGNAAGGNVAGGNVAGGNEAGGNDDRGNGAGGKGGRGRGAGGR